MPAESNNLESRVTALEQKLRVVTADAAAARVLAGGAHWDVSAMQDQLCAHTKLLNALRETQIEHGDKLGRIEGRFDGLERRLDGVDAKYELVDTRFDRVEARLDGLEGRMDGLEGRMDNLEGRMDNLEGRMGNLEGRMDSLEGRMDRLENTVTEGFAKVGADIAKVVELLAA